MNSRAEIWHYLFLFPGLSSFKVSSFASPAVLLLDNFNLYENDDRLERRPAESANDGLLELLVDSFVALLPPSLDDDVLLLFRLFRVILRIDWLKELVAEAS